MGVNFITEPYALWLLVVLYAAILISLAIRFRDVRIKDLMRADESIRRERALYKAVVETAVDGIMTVDDSGTIKTANRAVERIFLYEPSELIGRNVKTLLPTECHPDYDRYLDSHRKETDVQIIGVGTQLQGLRKDGTEFPLELAISETRTEQGTIHTGIVRDISERVLAERLVETSRDAAVKANAAKSDFLSRMSHEMRTPMNAILGFAQLLEMRSDDPEIRQSSETIVAAGRHLLNLVNEVLELSKIEAGRIAISIEPVMLSHAVNQAIDIVQPLAGRAGVELIDRSADLEDEFVLADRRHLVQVLINVISNAIKFNIPGGAVEISHESVKGSMQRILIRDTGIGIPAECAEKIFLPFERLGNASVEGTGLGLALSRSFLELMGGNLSLVHSGPEGSTFCIELRPAKSVVQIAIDASPSAKQIFASSDICGKILYVEDNISNMRLVEAVLAGFPRIELLLALQGQVGLEMARRNLPDLVFLDVHLPDISGLDVLRELKFNLDTQQIPVVVISADASENQIALLKSAGAFEYLTKPLDIPNFLEVTVRAMDHKDVSRKVGSHENGSVNS